MKPKDKLESMVKKFSLSEQIKYYENTNQPDKAKKLAMKLFAECEQDRKKYDAFSLVEFAKEHNLPKEIEIKYVDEAFRDVVKNSSDETILKMQKEYSISNDVLMPLIKERFENDKSNRCYHSAAIRAKHFSLPEEEMMEAGALYVKDRLEGITWSKNIRQSKYDMEKIKSIVDLIEEIKLPEIKVNNIVDSRIKQILAQEEQYSEDFTYQIAALLNPSKEVKELVAEEYYVRLLRENKGGEAEIVAVSNNIPSDKLQELPIKALDKLIREIENKSTHTSMDCATRIFVDDKYIDMLNKFVENNKNITEEQYSGKFRELLTNIIGKDKRGNSIDLGKRMFDKGLISKEILDEYVLEQLSHNFDAAKKIYEPDLEMLKRGLLEYNTHNIINYRRERDPKAHDYLNGWNDFIIDSMSKYHIEKNMVWPYVYKKLKDILEHTWYSDNIVSETMSSIKKIEMSLDVPVADYSNEIHNIIETQIKKERLNMAQALIDHYGIKKTIFRPIIENKIEQLIKQQDTQYHKRPMRDISELADFAGLKSFKQKYLQIYEIMHGNETDPQNQL